MVHDPTYGGEAETKKAAYSYFETGSTVIANQEAETIDAIVKAKNLIQDVVQKYNHCYTRPSNPDNKQQ